MRKHSRKIWFLCSVSFAIAVILLGSAGFLRIRAQGAAVEARVTSVQGSAAIAGNGRKSSRMVRGTTLAPGDEIDTRGGGRVVIDLTDGSQVIVMPGSRVVIGSYQNASSFRELLQIVLGRIRVKINHIQGKPNPYRIKSPTASIAVRGTEFEVSVEPLGDTRVVVIEGAVEVASLRDPANPLIAEPGRNVIVRPDFTIDFFAANVLSKEVGERDEKKQADAAAQKNADNNGNAQSATNAYERTTESVIESGETALPSRFAAFPDAHLDSLDNPAYADAFTNAEGRLNFVPSINGSSNAKEELLDRFGLRSPRPVDYSFVPAGTIFFPIKRFRAVVGGSFGYVHNGLQSLSINDNFPLSSPPFPVGTNGLRTVNGATSGKLLSGSLIFARHFGSRDKTSIGFSVERLFSRGNLNETITERAATGLPVTEQIASHSAVNRTRVTFGVKHDFGAARFGVFYRFGTSAGTDAVRFRIINGVPQPNDFIRNKGKSSEFGFRLRGALSRRLFYGVEGNVLFANTRENLRRAAIPDSTDRSRTNRSTLGFGLGYVPRPRTIFSFDITGGLINSNQRRTEDLTGDLMETERQRARFLSLHAAVQTDVWKNLFVSASLLSLTQSRTTDAIVFDDGLFSTSKHTRNFYTDFYSNYSVGWRFKPNFIFQYILTTDYGQTSPRHTFLLRYTFDFKQR